MAARFTPITFADMANFLSPMGFKTIQLAGTNEFVWGRRKDWQLFTEDGTELVDTIPLTIRVYSSITIEGSRKRGMDAIRVNLWAADSGGNVFMIGGDRRVHRVENWRQNLMERLQHWEQMTKPLCPICSAPMVHRGKKLPEGGFYGCIRFFGKGCRGTRSLDDAA